MREKSMAWAVLALVLVALPVLAGAAKAAPKTEVVYPTAVVLSPAFRDLPVDLKGNGVGSTPMKTIPNPQLNRPAPPGGSEAFSPDEVLQNRHGNAPAPSPLISFDGIDNVSGYAPPDTEGDIGPNHYMQWVNVSLAAWSINRSTWTQTLVLGPILGNTIWSSLTGQCASDNWGDPIVLWDRFRNRWVISQFSLGSGAGGPYKTVIAVSKTDDPTGQWWLYCYDFHASTMNDYPKFGVWPDGYYYTCNEFTGGGSAWGGAAVMVFEADKMTTGDPTARQLKIDLGAVSLNYGGILPAHFEGTNNPPAGSGYFVEVDDSTWFNPNLQQDSISLWKAHVDWTAGTFTVGVGGQPDLTIGVSNFTPLCIGNRDCIPQPGTTQRLDAIADRGMYRCQYRNLGSYEAMTFNLTVDSGSAVAGVRWFELRKDGGHPDWYLYQEGTYAPADGKHRWMGSAAQDHMGDLCVGYSISDGSATYPSVAYAGRLVGDPGGTLPQSEVIIHAGTASQTGVNRWGDYSTLSIDPVDDCTFWYTQEYTSGGWNWLTRIGAFKFPACSIGPTGTLSGTVTDSGTTLPIAGATVSATNGTITQNVTTGAGGTYSLTLPISPPNFDVTASAFGYTPSTVNGIVINTDATTTQNFALGGATSYAVSGAVTDVTTGWGLYANVTITASGWGGTTIQTNPTTGAYSINLVAGATYNFTVTSMVPGYNAGTATLGPLGGPATQNFPLAVNNCGAPGYTRNAFLENWDSVTAPALPSGWAMATVSGSPIWYTNVGTRYPSGGGAVSSPNVVLFNSYSSSSGQARLYRTAGIDLTGMASPVVNFYMFHDSGYSGDDDNVQVQVSTDGGTAWQNLGTPFSRTTGTGWIAHSVPLTGYTGSITDVRVAFLGTTAFGNDCHLDDIVIGDASCVTPPGGLIVGFVKDGGTTLPIAGASVANATTAFTGSSDAAGFYSVYANASVNNLTASKGTYQDATATPTGVAGATVQQDFNLSTSAQYTLSGTVTDAATGWPLYAALTFSGSSLPTVNAWTNPETGAYSVSIFGGSAYNVACTAWAPGYTPLATTAGPIGGNTTQDFTLSADLGSCGAPGYAATGAAQNWDGVTPPAMPSGWSSVSVSGTASVWATNVGTRYPSGGGTHSSPNLVFFNSYSASSGNSARLTLTTTFDIATLSPAAISFWMYHDSGYSTPPYDRVQVQVSTDGGTVWQNVGTAIDRYAASPGWTSHTVPLTGFTGPTNAVQIGILGISEWGNDVHIDDITIGTPSCTAPAGGGLIVGNVYDANTLAAMNGAAVNNTTSGKTATSAATPSDPNVDDGFYCIYGADGANAMNATAPLYGTDNQTPTVPHFGAVRQDFHLGVGQLTATPTSLTYTLTAGQTGSQTFDLTNVGSASLNFTLSEAPGHLAPQKLNLAAKDQRPEGWAKGHMLTAFKKKPVKALWAANGPRIVLSLQQQDDAKAAGHPVPPIARGKSTASAPNDPWPPSGSVQLFVDDNGAEDSIGVNSSTAAYQFVWANRFTPSPADFPFLLDQISVVLGSGAAPSGGSLELAVWQDTDGDGDPSNATLLGTFSVTAAISDNATWNNYTLTSPVLCAGPGDVIVGVINRYTVSGVDAPIYPASIDTTASQGRSWGGWWVADPPEPPILPPDNTWGTIDSLGFPGNWLIRASGNPADVPWLDENPKTGPIAASGTQTITVSYDATSLAPGDYLATIRASQDTPYPAEMVHVTLHVTSNCPAITLSPSSLPGGSVGTPYNQTLTASGGTAPYTYAVTVGTLPPPLSLSASGVITGTPTTAGNYTFTVTATDAAACTGSQEYTISVNCPTITLSPTTLPGSAVGAAYNQTLTASGGIAPYTYAVTAGTLPPVLGLSAGGVLSGTPTTLGSYSFTVTATDAHGCTGSNSYVVAVSSYDWHFVDDSRRSEMCVNSTTGAWIFKILSGTGAGTTFAGAGTITTGSGYSRLAAAAGRRRESEPHLLHDGPSGYGDLLEPHGGFRAVRCGYDE